MIKLGFYALLFEHCLKNTQNIYRLSRIFQFNNKISQEDKLSEDNSFYNVKNTF